jgi:hypothetical protein
MRRTYGTAPGAQSRSRLNQAPRASLALPCDGGLPCPLAPLAMSTRPPPHQRRFASAAGRGGSVHRGRRCSRRGARRLERGGAARRLLRRAAERRPAVCGLSAMHVAAAVQQPGWTGLAGRSRLGAGAIRSRGAPEQARDGPGALPLLFEHSAQPPAATAAGPAMRAGWTADEPASHRCRRPLRLGADEAAGPRAATAGGGGGGCDDRRPARVLPFSLVATTFSP